MLDEGQIIPLSGSLFNSALIYFNQFLRRKTTWTGKERSVVSDNAVVDSIFNRGITGSWSCQGWELVQKSLEGNAIGQGCRDIAKK